MTHYLKKLTCMLKSQTSNSSSCTSTKCSMYDAHSTAKSSYLNPFLHKGAGLYITTTIIESLFTLIIQSNSSNCVISLVVTLFPNEMSFL